MGLERAEIIVKGVFGVQGSGFWEYHKAHFKILVDCFKMTGLMQIAQDAIQKATQEAVSAHRQAQQTLGLYQSQGTAFQPNGNCLQAFQDSAGSAIAQGWFLNAYLVPPLSDQGLRPEAASSLRKLAERYRETHELCERAAHELSSMIAALQVTIGVIRLLEKEATRAKAKIDASKGKAFGAGIASMGVERAQQFAALDAEMNNVNSDDLTGELVNDMNACDKAIASFFLAYAQFETDFAKILFRQM